MRVLRHRPPPALHPGVAGLALRLRRRRASQAKPAPVTHHPRKVNAALVAVTLGVTLSLTANVLATLPDPVRVVGGVAASLTLPTAVHLWRVVPVEQWWWRLLRGAVMLGIAALAAVVSFAHAWHLLVAHGEHPGLAAAYPISVELLVVMGVLARRTPNKARAQPRRQATGPSVVSAPKATSKREAARTWARTNWSPTLRPHDIRLGLLAGGVTIDKTTASRAYRAVADEHAA